VQEEALVGNEVTFGSQRKEGHGGHAKQQSSDSSIQDQAWPVLETSKICIQGPKQILRPLDHSSSDTSDDAQLAGSRQLGPICRSHVEQPVGSRNQQDTVPQDGPPAFGVQAPRVYADLPKQGSPLAQDVKLAELQQEMEKLCKEREHVAAVKSTLELAARALEQERAAFEAQKVWL
jgi:hypothetical protein